MRFHETKQLARYAKENRGNRRQKRIVIGTTTKLVLDATLALTDDELISKAAEIRAEWDKAHNELR
jgi:hypothetical protein